ncbi:ABC transporter ATP-binding protein [Pseudochelatococcus sp. B33]
MLHLVSEGQASSPSTADGAPLLSVEDLKTYFFTREGVAKAVDGVSYSVGRGETLGVVGESGCGKSVTALSILGLVPRPAGQTVGGRIMLEGTNLLDLSDREMQRIRGKNVSMIFQEPMTSLNPVMPVGSQIAEAVSLHEGLSRRAALDWAGEMLKLVRIPDVARRLKEYPHQLSGGMRQRVMIAMALACSPKVLIADEPTTALDVTVQAQILELMAELQQRTQTAIVLITHDLGVIAETANRVVVMYAGRKVEEAEVTELFSTPLHPYTVGLLHSMPSVEKERGGNGELAEIPGLVPPLYALPPGCRFAPRCQFATERCHLVEPPLEEHQPGHWAACWYAKEMPGSTHA